MSCTCDSRGSRRLPTRPRRRTRGRPDRAGPRSLIARLNSTCGKAVRRLLCNFAFWVLRVSKTCSATVVNHNGCDGNQRLLSLRCGPLFHSMHRSRSLWWPYGTRSWTGTLSTTCSVSPSRSGCDRTSAASVSGALSSESFDARLAHSRRFVGPLS